MDWQDTTNKKGDNSIKSKIFMIFILSCLILTNFVQVVSADVTEITRTFYIESNPDFDYMASLNIVNGTNVAYTNYELLIKPFTTDSGIDGGYSGSFLPPAKFQLNDASSSDINNHLILSSVVKFKTNNLLSGASSSWWRCPYYYNSDYVLNRNWALDLSIYHVDTPRTANLTFPTVGTNNYPARPTAESHPSLVFAKSYIDCGQTQNNEQYNYSINGKLPANDTLQNPDEPLNITPSSPNYNPYMWMIDDSYNHTVQYSMSWFNVLAPIYPNESYMVIWDIHDSILFDDDAGSFWLTASDIGSDYHGRTLASWNDRDIYEIPLDLDNSVIFQIGMGAGVTGAKLEYNSGSDYQDHTSAFTNPSFENNIWGIQEDYNSFLGWNNYPSINGWAKHNAIINSADFLVNATGSPPYMEFPTFLSTEGVHFKFDIEFYPLQWIDSGDTYFSSRIKILLSDTTATTQADIIITKWTKIDGISGAITHFNNIEYLIIGGTYEQYILPDTFPDRIYLSIETLTASNEILVSIYNQDSPNSIYYSHYISNPYNLAGLSDVIKIVGSCPDLGTSYTFSTTNNLVVRVNKLIGIERTNFLNGWTTFSLGTANSKQDYYNGFETIVPDNSIPIPSNTKCFGITQKSQSACYGYIEQISSVIPTVNLRRAFVDGHYRMMSNDSSEPYTNSYFEIRLGGRDAFSSTWSYVTNTFYAIDGSWHQVSTGHLTGNFDRFRVRALFSFPATASGNVDLKIGQFDNIKVYSIYNDPNKNVHEFNQKVNQNDLSATNYYTFMLPIKQSVDPDFEPYASLRFKDENDAIKYNLLTMPSDFYDDFILISINSSFIIAFPSITYVTIVLYNFCSDAYIFLQDRNSDFYLNNATEYKNNYFRTYNVQTSSTTDAETFFSPYYSLRATEGQWINADSQFTTTYFYYVSVKYVQFIDNNVEVIEIAFGIVNATDLVMFTEDLKAFGEVYNDEEWLAYLEVRNRPGVTDKIIDWFTNTSIGEFLYAIGKKIWNVLEFWTPVIEDIVNLLIEVIVLVISLIIYFLSVWIMWKFVKFWILIGEGKTEEAIMEFQSVTSSITGAVTGVATKVASRRSKGK